MLFTSFEFFILVIVTAILYYLPICKKYQLYILILSSFVFYAYHSFPLLLLLTSSMGINVLSSFKVVRGPPKFRLHWAVAGVAANLGILGFFKYSPLIGNTFWSGNTLGEFLISIPLPVGISFFTFQGISLVVDVYREKDISESNNIVVKNVVAHSLRVSCYISFFAQLVAGPIVKAHEFIPQIRIKIWKEIHWQQAFHALVLGYFLKMVIADNLNDYTFRIAYPHFLSSSTLTLVTMLFGFSMQIFSDFAGYSLIAIGIAKIFGYNLPANFNFPYVSTSFSEFWTRWHISLSTFLKKYLYIPLGGNKKGNSRTYINLMVTMILGGLWHGAAWSYAVWGAFHGVMLAFERVCKHTFSLPNFKGLPLIKGFLVFSGVSIAWLLFKLPEFSHVIIYLEKLGANILNNDSHSTIRYIVLYSLPVIFFHFYYLLKVNKNEKVFLKLKPVLYGFMIFLIITDQGASANFIYFQF